MLVLLEMVIFKVMCNILAAGNIECPFYFVSEHCLHRPWYPVTAVVLGDKTQGICCSNNANKLLQKSASMGFQASAAGQVYLRTSGILHRSRMVVCYRRPRLDCLTL
jgi:hypothetical protein